MSGLLLANNWHTALMLATSEYPVSWLDPRTEAFLGIILQLAGGFSLLLGLGTRLGALAIVVLNVATQVYYESLDLNLFRIALALGYVLRGSGPLSLDSLLIKGLWRSPIPFAAPIARFFGETRALFSATYRLGLRVWLALALLMASSVVSSALGHVAAPLSLWVPSAFGHCALCRSSAVASISSRPRSSHAAHCHSGASAIGYSEMMAADDFSMFWTLGMALLLVSGPGALSFDDMILSVLKRRFPQLDGKRLAPRRDHWRGLLRHSLRQGAAPYCVELTRAIAELARFGMGKDFRSIDPSAANILLVQAAPRILPTFPEKLSRRAQQSLERIGVKVLADSKVQNIDADGVMIADERSYSKSAIWAAGVVASPAAKWLKAESDGAGRVKVESDLSVPNLRNVFVIVRRSASPPGMADQCPAWRRQPSKAVSI